MKVLLLLVALFAASQGVRVWSKAEGIKLKAVDTPCGLPSCACGCSETGSCDCAKKAMTFTAPPCTTN